MYLNLRSSYLLVILNLIFNIENSRLLIRKALKLNVINLIIYRLDIRKRI